MGNTVLAQTGIVGFGPQTAKGTMATTFYRYKAMRAALGAVEDNRTAQLEVGGVPYPTGAFKAGAFFGGEAVLQPRLEGDIGWVLYAACGNVSTVSDCPEAGLYTHVFRPDPSATSTIKWLSARVMTPGATSSDNLGSIGLDCRIPQLRIVVPQNDVVTAMLTVQGRVPSWANAEAANAWTWADDYEDFDSVPISVKGHFEVPDDTSIPALGVDITLANVLTDVRREMIVGEYHPDDLAVITRNMMISFVHKYPDPARYLASVANEDDPFASAMPWSPVVNTQSCELKVESPANISGKSNPYSLTLKASKVNWVAEGPPVLTAGDMLSIRYTGTVLEPDSGDYFELHLVNSQVAFQWPA